MLWKVAILRKESYFRHTLAPNKMLLNPSVAVFIFYLFGKGLVILERSFLSGTLSKAAMGEYRAVHHGAMLLAYLDLSAGIVRYLANFREDQKKKRAFFSFVLFATTVVWLVATLLFYCFQEMVPYWWWADYKGVIFDPTIFVLGYCIMLDITLKAWLRGLQHVVWPNFLHQLGLGVFLILNVRWLQDATISLTHFPKQSLIPYGCLLVMYFIYLAYIDELHIRWWHHCFDTAFLFHFLRYSLFAFVVSVVHLMPRIDAIMVRYYCGKEALPTYEIASFLATLLHIIVRVSKNTNEATLATMLLDSDSKTLKKFYQKIVLYQCMAIVLGIFVLYDFLPLQIVINKAHPSEVHSTVERIFLVLGAAEVINCLFDTSQILLVLSKHYAKTLFFTPVVVVVGILGNRLMIQQFSILGAAYATFLTLSLGGMIALTITWRCLGIHPFTRKLLSLIPITLCTLLVKKMLPVVADPLQHFLLHSMVALVVYSLLVWAMGLLDDIKLLRNKRL